MAKIRLKSEWAAAFRAQNGYYLMALLREEPRLLTHKYCGCNVLHLAMRKRWYGLVREILQKFNHLHENAPPIDGASLSRSESADPKQDNGGTADSQTRRGDFQSREGSVLHVAIFRNLLEAKEGDADASSSTEDANWNYASGLDVFAMAVIQGHRAINTLLAEAVSKVDGLFDDSHRYKDVIRGIGEESEGSNTSASPADLSFHKEERAMLCEIIEKCFAVESNLASNISATEEKIPTDSRATPGSSGPNLKHQLEDKIDPACKRAWKVTSPFLPFEEFLFLDCCQHASSWGGNPAKNKTVEAVKRRVLEVCAARKEETSFMKYLLEINDTWGNAILHALRSQTASPELAGWTSPPELPGSTAPTILPERCFRRDLIPTIREMMPIEERAYVVRDNMGRTPIQIALALGLRNTLRLLLKDPRSRTDVEEPRKTGICGRWVFERRLWEIDVKTVSEVNGYSAADICRVDTTTAFHHIIRSPHLSDLDRKFMTRILLIHSRHLIGGGGSPTVQAKTLMLTPLQFAAYQGDAATLQLLACDDRAYDPARLYNLSAKPAFYWKDFSALHLAAIAGHPHAIRNLLATGKFDPLVCDGEGNTALHLAAHFEFPLYFPHSLADFCEIPYGRIGNPYKPEWSLSVEERRELVQMAESGREACISLLLQAGIDVWQTNNSSEIADPGPKASLEYRTWWYEKLSKETQEAKTSSNDAANAISVTAALVATASYVGPLQPPLGYAAQSEGLIEQMQVGILSVRIFIVCNTLAFYFALAAIILSLTPSLPMPQVSTLDKVKLVRRTLTLAVPLLILSIVAILLAFASASIAVIPDNESWNHGGLTASTLVIGGFICFLVLALCSFRLLRLSFDTSISVRRLYRKYVCI